MKPFADVTVIIDTQTRYPFFYLGRVKRQPNIENQQRGTAMATIPDPSDLLDAARSTQRHIEDRVWKRYQRYLRKLREQRASSPNKQPLTFEEFLDTQQNQENSN